MKGILSHNPKALLEIHTGKRYLGCMSKAPQRPRDPNQLAKRIVDLATGEVAPDPEADALTPAQELGKLGGAARARKLTAEQRVQIARQGAAKRWKGEPN